jgi:hypothetical protein
MHDTLVKRREGGQWLDREEWQLGIRRCLININKPVPIYTVYIAIVMTDKGMILTLNFTRIQ